MIVTIIILALMYLYLLYESDWLRIRLPMGSTRPPKYARYNAYNALTKAMRNAVLLRSGNNYPEGYSPNGEPEYTIMLDPGITEPLCGWAWLDKHCADLVDYQPQVYMEIGNVRYTMTVKDQSILKDVMRVNKLTKKQIQALV